MDMMTATKTCFRKYVDFKGRAARSEYWWFVLAIFIGSILLTLVDGFVLGMWDFQPLSTIFALATLLPSLAVAVRRLHDTNRSGWWILLPFSALIIVILGAVLASMPLIAIGGLVYLGLAILLIVWLATKGTAGDNRFGANPLGQ